MNKTTMFKWLDSQSELLSTLAKQIWDHPELPFAEKTAAELQAAILKKNQFRLKEVPSIPTAIVAEYGQGRPIIGILGEYDALAGLSNYVATDCDPVVAGDPGHGCGHNLLGTAGVGAALAIKEAIDAGAVKGTVRYYGCPAEETLAGKVFMAREGVFSDLDASFYWHPASINAVSHCSMLAMNSVEFTFHGLSAHAAAAPHLGRSALDAVELMNVGANYLREHISSEARIHYTITNGGSAPNIVPATASVWYYIRAPKRQIVDEIYERLLNIARGAALMTDTTAQWNFLSGCYDTLSNQALESILDKNIAEAPLPNFSQTERLFAKNLRATMTPEARSKVLEMYRAPLELDHMAIHEDITNLADEGKIMSGSIDTGDVSWIAPYAMFRGATWPVGIASHTWQGTAASGSSLAMKGMLFAAKVLAGTLYDLYTTESTVLGQAKKEFQVKTKGEAYVSPLPPEAKVPLT